MWRRPHANERDTHSSGASRFRADGGGVPLRGAPSTYRSRPRLGTLIMWRGCNGGAIAAAARRAGGGRRADGGSLTLRIHVEAAVEGARGTDEEGRGGEGRRARGQVERRANAAITQNTPSRTTLDGCRDDAVAGHEPSRTTRHHTLFFLFQSSFRSIFN